MSSKGETKARKYKITLMKKNAKNKIIINSAIFFDESDRKNNMNIQLVYKFHSVCPTYLKGLIKDCSSANTK